MEELFYRVFLLFYTRWVDSMQDLKRSFQNQLSVFVTEVQKLGLIVNEDEQR